MTIYRQLGRKLSLPTLDFRIGRRWTAALAVIFTAIVLSAPARAAGDGPLVFAAASMKNALDDVAAQYAKETGKHVVLSYAASSALAKQIEAGAPADIFISADIDWMDYLDKHHGIKPDTRRNLLGNKLVLIAPKGAATEVKIEPHFPLAKLLNGGRLAMANPDSVPAGKYGKAALESLGVWASVGKSVAPAQNVRVALAYVSRGETPLGIVYRTDAVADPGVTVVGTFPDDTHPPIIYPVAVTANSMNPGTADFLAYMESPKAAPLFEKQGFAVLKK
jgi:molybdate transport system substrate-binding protein